MNTDKITGIVLAGGKSTRMGSDKSLLKLGAKTLLEIAINTLQPLCNQIIISSNSKPETKHLVVADEYLGIGPLGGIISALKESKNDLNFVLSCDLPFIETSLLKTLPVVIMENWAVIPSTDHKNLEPLCGLYHKKSLSTLVREANNNNYKLHNILRNFPIEIIDLSDKKDQFLNINKPDDYQKALDKFS